MEADGGSQHTTSLVLPLNRTLAQETFGAAEEELEGTDRYMRGLKELEAHLVKNGTGHNIVVGE